ncbi:MAG: hypothetical protein IT534_09055 [Bauldia sp.]|nr:hypothetical protein [Bauldia sp.]
MAIGTFASLVNSKVVVPSTRNDYWAVNKHFLSDLLSTRLGQVYVDQAWYLGRYPDVAKAIETGSVADAAEHYRKYGFFEHRMPMRIEVQEDWYLSEYADVGIAVRERVFPSAQAHFDLVGYAEGRLPHANFALVEVTEGAAGERHEAKRPARTVASRTGLGSQATEAEVIAGAKSAAGDETRNGTWRRAP